MSGILTRFSTGQMGWLHPSQPFKQFSPHGHPKLLLKNDITTYDKQGSNETLITKKFFSRTGGYASGIIVAITHTFNELFIAISLTLFSQFCVAKT